MPEIISTNVPLRPAGDSDVRRFKAAHRLVEGKGGGESVVRALWHARNRDRRLRVIYDERVVVPTIRTGIRHYFAIAQAAQDIRLFQIHMAGRAQTTVLDDDERFDHHLPVQPREVAAGQRRIPLPAASLFVQLKGRQRKRRRRARHLEVSRIHILRMRSIRNRLGEGNQPGERIGVRVLSWSGPSARSYLYSARPER